MSDADRVALAYAKETTFGVDPAGTYNALRATGESIAKITGTTRSNEIRSDRQIDDIIRNGIRVNGGFDFELSYGSFDLLLLAVLMASGSAWAGASVILDVNGNNAITITASTGNVSDDAAGNLFSAVAVGEWLRLKNFSNSANNGMFKVIGKTDDDNIQVAGIAAMVDETRAASAGSDNAYIERPGDAWNGTTLSSFSFQKNFVDESKFALFRGLSPESLSLDVRADQIVTGSFQFLGKDGDALSGSGNSVGSPSTTDPMNAIDHVLAILEGAPAANQNNELAVNQATIQIANNLRERSNVGELGPASLGSGKVNVSGTLRAYFASQAAYDKYVNFTASAVAFMFKDGAGNFTVIDCPSVKFTAGPILATGPNSDVMAELGWEAYRNETENLTVRIVQSAA